MENTILQEMNSLAQYSDKSISHTSVFAVPVIPESFGYNLNSDWYVICATTTESAYEVHLKILFY